MPAGPVFRGQADGVPSSTIGPILGGLADGIPSSTVGPTFHGQDLQPFLASGEVFQHTVDALSTEAAGSNFQHTVDFIPGQSSGPIYQHEVEAQFMGIRAKQMAASTFDQTETTRVFAAQSIVGTRLVNGTIDTTQLASNAVDENKIATSAIGDGLSGGGGSVLVVNPDSTTGGDVVPVDVTSNGVGLDVSDIDGVGIEANGSGELQLSAQGNGISGGAGSTLSVDPDTGLTVGVGGVGVDTGSTVDFSADTPIWTFGNETTGEGLFVSGTPQDANHVPNKNYVDSAISGITWLPPVHVKEMVGSEGAASIEGLTPTAGDAYVVDDVSGGEAPAGDLVGATVGDIWEYNGATWDLIVAGSGGFVASGYRALASIQTALNGSIGLVNNTDDGKVLEWDGTSLTPAKTTPSSGDGVLVTDQDADGDSIYANNGYTFEGSVPTGTWNQFSGAGQINAGTGMAKDGNTLNVGDVNKGVQANANDLQVDASEIAGDGLEQLSGGGNEHIIKVQSDTTTGGNVVPIDVTSNGIGLDVDDINGTGLEANAGTLRLTTQGAGIAGGAGSALTFDATAADGDGLSGSGNTLTVDPDATTGGNVVPVDVTANGVGLDVDDIDGVGIEANGSGLLQISTQGNGITGGGGTTISVDPHNGIAVDANGVAVAPAQLIKDGNAEIDGDQLDIDFTPANYTPDSGPAEVTDVDHLSAHLKGIDDAISAAGGTPRQESITTENITGTDTAISDTINNTPSAAIAVKLFLNGILQVQGAGADYSLSGTTITWLASTGTAVDMDTSDVMIAVYES